MRKLILVRHSISDLTVGIPPERWPLTEEGRALCIPLAAQVAQWAPEIVFTSVEPKAHETGQIIGRELGLSVETKEGLHEHVRPAFHKISTQEVFIQTVERLFDEPDQLVFGKETAAQSLARYDRAVREALAKKPGNIALASHGTVMALFVGKYNQIDQKAFWRKLKMPDVVVLDAETFTLQPC